MNREIKFRAWTTNGNRWATHTELLEVIPVSATIIAPSIISVGKEDDEWVFQQYTGLKDKNGTPIYEGDVIATKPLFDGDEPYFIVEWGKDEHTKMTGWMQRNTTTGLGVLDNSILTGEVIGNIYENPNFLKSSD